MLQLFQQVLSFHKMVPLLLVLALTLLLFLAVWPADSPLRAPDGQITSFSAPLMSSIVPLIFLLFLIPGAVYGYVAGTIDTHRDLIKGMSKTRMKVRLQSSTMRPPTRKKSVFAC